MWDWWREQRYCNTLGSFKQVHADNWATSHSYIDYARGGQVEWSLVLRRTDRIHNFHRPGSIAAGNLDDANLVRDIERVVVRRQAHVRLLQPVGPVHGQRGRIHVSNAHMGCCGVDSTQQLRFQPRMTMARG